MISTQGRFTAQEMLDIITPVCSALDAAHAAGVVHRDLKANNVNLAVNNARYVVKLLDFGIAKLLDPTRDRGLTQAGSRWAPPPPWRPSRSGASRSISGWTSMRWACWSTTC